MELSRYVRETISQEKLEEYLAFVLPKDTPLPELVFKQAKGRWVTGRFRPFNYRVTLMLKRGLAFPYRTIKGRGYIGAELHSLEEGIVFVLAHELRHCWQCKHPGAKRAYKARGLYSERDADAFGIYKLNKWRAMRSKALAGKEEQNVESQN